MLFERTENQKKIQFTHILFHLWTIYHVGNIDDFAPTSEHTDADFWAVGDSDDDDQEKDDDDDDAGHDAPKYSIAKDEEPDFDEDEDEDEEEKVCPIYYNISL